MIILDDLLLRRRNVVAIAPKMMATEIYQVMRVLPLLMMYGCKSDKISILKTRVIIWRCRIVLSADGTVVAIGADFNNGNGGSSGHVRIYTLDDGSWVQISQDIDGEAAGDYSGGSVSLSADGTVVAIGADFNNGNGIRSGHVRIYALNALSTDPDGDNLSNFKELHLYGTDTK